MVTLPPCENARTASRAIKDDNEVGHLRADLKTETRTARSDKRRTAPSVACPCDDNALATFAAETESNFQNANDGETARFAQNSLPECSAQACGGNRE